MAAARAHSVSGDYAMRRLFPALICLAALAAASGFAEEAVPLPPAPVSTLRPAISQGNENQDPAVEHLLKAAEHLEAAGMNEEAAKLRHDARQRASHENVLSRKESELECLQEEVDRLRTMLGQATGIQIDVMAVEVDRNRLGLKGAEFDKLIGLAHAASGGHVQSAEASGIVEANPARLPLFRDLCERGILKVLAEPTLTTTSGRPANFFDGGEVAVRVKSDKGEISMRNVRFGTDLEVVAEIRPNQRVRLQTSFELRELQNNAIDDDGTSQPEIRSRRLNTQVEMQPGQTLTLARLTSRRSKAASAAGAVVKSPTTKNSVAKSETGERKPPAGPVTESNPAPETVEMIVFVTPRLLQLGIVPRSTESVPAEDELQEDDTLQPIVPAAFDPTDASAFGPAIPILKRRTVRE